MVMDTAALEAAITLPEWWCPFFGMKPQVPHLYRPRLEGDFERFRPKSSLAGSDGDGRGGAVDFAALDPEAVEPTTAAVARGLESGDGLALSF